MMSSSTAFRSLVNRGVRGAAGVAAASWLMIVLPAGGTERVPEGLSASDWSSIRAAYEANRHAAFPVEGGWQTRNPGQQWRTRFDGRGFETTPNGGGWSWGLALLNYGRECAEGDPSRKSLPAAAGEGAGSLPVCVRADGGRIEYEWDDTLTEWYVNDQRGLEHGYTVHRRPDSYHTREGGNPAWERPLQFTLAVRGGLRPQVSGDGRSVSTVR